jgi:filamentous hemagglutinin family protein
MNSIYQSIWNEKTGTFVAVSENTKRGGKKTSSCSTAAGTGVRFALQAMAACVLLSLGAQAWSAPVGGVVLGGDVNAKITSGAGVTTINQSAQNVAINWASFNIAQGETVHFVQPSSTSVALNRVLGSESSSIMGNLTANGKVFLINPNGILFGKTASVNVGGLVASTMDISDADFMAGNYKFTGAGNGTVKVEKDGAITAADRGFVALLGAEVSNDGVIIAKLGSVVLAAGKAATLDVAGDGLLSVTIDQGALNALVSNGGIIKADGGQVLLTAQAAGQLLNTMVSNTGVIQAQTVENHNGVIKLLGDMQSGTVNASGTLDASAPNGGDGGFIETSAARVNIANDVNITTAASFGKTGTFLIDPADITIGDVSAGANISNTTLQDILVRTDVVISTFTQTALPANGEVLPVTALTTGNGDINLNGALVWDPGSGNPTTLTLKAVGDVNINAAIDATNGNLNVCCGTNINVNAAITMVNGSILMSAGNDINVDAAVTATDGNITMCAAHDINVRDAITLTNGTLIPGNSFLGMAEGLVLSAGYGGTGPGIAGGTLVYGLAAPTTAVTNAPANIYYNPVSYTAPTDYLPKFTLTGGATLTQRMLVFAAGGDKVFDGTTSATLSSLKGNPDGVSLVAGPGSTASFGTSSPGTGKIITYTGYTLEGPRANEYALAFNCCGPIVAHTSANITNAVALPPVRPPVETLPIATLPLIFESADSLMPAAFTFMPAETPPSQSSLASTVVDQAPLEQPAQSSLVDQAPAEQPAVAMAPEQPAVSPRVQAPVRYVAPIFPRKQDRN